MKNQLWKIILIFLFYLCNAGRAEEMDLLSQIYLSNKKYAKNIEVKAFLVTKEQVVEAFNDKNAQIIQKTNRELSNRELFLLVRCKNVGSYRAFGVLNCKLPDRGVPVSIEIDALPANNSVHDCVIYIDAGLDPNSNTTPIIICQWKSLYTI